MGKKHFKISGIGEFARKMISTKKDAEGRSTSLTNGKSRLSRTHDDDIYI